MLLVEALEGRRQLFENRPGITQVYAEHVVTLEGVDEASAMPLLCGLHTGVLMGFKPSAQASALVRWRYRHHRCR